MEHLVTPQQTKPAVFEVRGFGWKGNYRPAAKKAIKELLENQMVHWADQRL